MDEFNQYSLVALEGSFSELWPVIYNLSRTFQLLKNKLLKHIFFATQTFNVPSNTQIKSS